MSSQMKYFIKESYMKNLQQFSSIGTRLLMIAVFLIPLVAGFTTPVAAASENAGALYTLTNAASGNQVLAYSRATDGSLVFQSSYATGGLGSGSGLGSQSA